MARRANNEGVELTNFFAGGDDKREELLAEPAQSGSDCSNCSYDCGLCDCRTKCDCNCYQLCKANCGTPDTVFAVYGSNSQLLRNNLNKADLEQLMADLAKSLYTSISNASIKQVSTTHSGE